MPETQLDSPDARCQMQSSVAVVPECQHARAPQRCRRVFGPPLPRASVVDMLPGRSGDVNLAPTPHNGEMQLTRIVWRPRSSARPLTRPFTPALLAPEMAKLAKPTRADADDVNRRLPLCCSRL